MRTYILQSPAGQIMGTSSISAGLDYPGVGPEHAFLKDSGRAEYMVATDEQALRGFRMCTEMEGIIPALETAHAIWSTVQLAASLPKEQNIVMVSLSLSYLVATFTDCRFHSQCLSGRGDVSLFSSSFSNRN